MADGSTGQDEKTRATETTSSTAALRELARQITCRRAMREAAARYGVGGEERVEAEASGEGRSSRARPCCR